jgi:hypothetical protein
MIALIIVLASGITGKYLLKRALATVHSRRQGLMQQGLSAQEADARLFWDALVVEGMKKWRSVHFVLAYVFVFLASMHIASILIFWNWHI